MQRARLIQPVARIHIATITQHRPIGRIAAAEALIHPALDRQAGSTARCEQLGVEFGVVPAGTVVAGIDDHDALSFGGGAHGAAGRSEP